MTKLKLYQTTALAGLMVATISLWTAPAFAQTKDQATTTDDTVVVVTAAASLARIVISVSASDARCVLAAARSARS